MAKLTALPSMAIIDGFKKTVDFYVYMGIPVARAWPRSPGHIRSPAVMAAWAPFSEASRAWRETSPEWRTAFELMARRSGLSGRDLSVAAYMSGLYRYPNEPV